MNSKLEHEQRRPEPNHGPGDRVTTSGDGQEGRVQSVSFVGDTFRYVVKWDVGPTTPHNEAELRPAVLPTHYQ